MSRLLEMIKGDTLCFTDLDEEQNKMIMSIMKVKHGLCRVKIKHDVFDILTKGSPDQIIYQGIKKYAGTKCIVYNILDIDLDYGWYILGSDSIAITIDCFEVIL